MSNREEPLKEPWFAVRCLFSHPTRKQSSEAQLFEERITLWRADSWDQAFTAAEAEAADYAVSANCIFVRALDGFNLFDRTVGEGTEIWSVMRGSNMDADIYILTFCKTATDRIGNHRIRNEEEEADEQSS
jgi:hypothetical protein